jgi:hypothetical protein
MLIPRLLCAKLIQPDPQGGDVGLKAGHTAEREISDGWTRLLLDISENDEALTLFNRKMASPVLVIGRIRRRCNEQALRSPENVPELPSRSSQALPQNRINELGRVPCRASVRNQR